MRHALLAALLPCALFACDDDEGTPAQMTPADAAIEADMGLDVDAEVEADAAVEADAEPPAPEPDEPGPWNVGFHTETIEYAAPDGPRELDLHWWYPTADEMGNSVRYGGIFLRREVIAEAAPALDEPAPVVVFSHGNLGFAEQSFFFTEHFASHGWVVLALDHTGNTTFEDSIPVHELFDLRPLDVKATLDHVDALPAEHLLAGRLGPQRGLSGHSFGGYTTLAVGGAGYDVEAMSAACEGAACDYLSTAEARFRAGYGDDRLQALLPMTPAGAALFADGLADIEVPTLLMTAGRDQVLPDPVEGDPIWAALPDDALRLAFPDGGHFTFSNICTFAPGVADDDGCGETFVPVAEAHRIINGYALAFFEQTLLGETRFGDLLDGTRTLGAGAELIQK